MKFINKFKSKNYNRRRTTRIKYIILHYTALPDYKKAISFLCNKQNKVSCHYLISQTGEIYNLVPNDMRAWHAGLSKWEDDNDINSLSIGIELDFSFKGKNNNYSTKLVNSLINLLKYIINKYNIPKENVLGHSDVAPLRKIDPGLTFCWKKLAKHNLSFHPKKNFKIYYKSLESWLESLKFKSLKKKSIFMLSFIGYNVEMVSKNNKKFKKLIINYQSHFNQSKVTGILDSGTYNLIKNHLLNLVLTKN